MTYHIYAFGSICRGEVTPQSDIDLLAIVDGFDSRFDPHTYSIYSKQRLRELWAEGNPFAWHLAMESKLLYASDGMDTLSKFGAPQAYLNAEWDCQKFHLLFLDALSSITSSNASRIFDLSAMFLAVRNFATCYMLGVQRRCNFSRDSAIQMEEDSVPIPKSTYDLLVRSRLVATRGLGDYITSDEILGQLETLPLVDEWMKRLRNDAFGTT